MFLSDVDKESMKRNMDLIRDILLFAEKHESYPDVGKVPFTKDGVSELAISFHIELLENAKFVIAQSGNEMYG